MNENVLNQNDASVLAINLLFICSSGYLFPDPSFFLVVLYFSIAVGLYVHWFDSNFINIF